MPPEEFARERLGWWDAPEDEAAQPITVEAWAACADPGGQVAGTPVLAVDVAPDRSAACIALAGRRADGLTQVEVVRHGPGAAWVDAELDRASAAGIRVVAVDGRSQAAALVPGLEAAGWTVHVLGAADQVEACVGLHRDVLEVRVRHLGDPVLARALAVATTRPVGDGGGWAWARRRSDGDITPLVAVTDARWALALSADGIASDIF